MSVCSCRRRKHYNGFALRLFCSTAAFSLTLNHFTLAARMENLGKISRFMGHCRVETDLKVHFVVNDAFASGPLEIGEIFDSGSPVF